MGWKGILNTVVTSAKRYDRLKRQQVVDNIIENTSNELTNDKKFRKCKNLDERMLYIELKYPELKNEKTIIKKIASRAAAIIKVINL